MKTNPAALLAPSREEGLKLSVVLNNGVSMPWFGLGVWQMNELETREMVTAAIELGYRSIDTARLYANEAAVGEAIRSSGVRREDIFVTTKVWNDDIRRGRIAAAFEESLRRLGLEYVDLFLLHWPIAGKLSAAWKDLERVYKSGRVRAIGVSNYMVPHLEELLAQAEIVPAINQIEYHPYLQSRGLANYCKTRGIRLEAWSPLMQGGAILRDPALNAIARRHGKTVAQVVLRWDLQSGVITIPKSSRRERLIENSDIYDFALSEEDMAAISGLERSLRSGADPMNFNF
jgi:methylglyoxal/glyoxal reductase